MCVRTHARASHGTQGYSRRTHSRTYGHRPPTHDGSGPARAPPRRAFDGTVKAPLINGKERTVNGKKRTVNGKKRTVNGKNWTVDGKKRTVNGKKRTVDGEKRTVNGEKTGPLADNRRIPPLGR